MKFRSMCNVYKIVILSRKYYLSYNSLIRTNIVLINADNSFPFTFFSFEIIIERIFVLVLLYIIISCSSSESFLSFSLPLIERNRFNRFIFHGPLKLYPRSNFIGIFYHFHFLRLIWFRFSELHYVPPKFSISLSDVL